MHTVNFCPGGQPTTYFCRGAKLQASTSDISGGLFGIRSLGCRWLALPLPDKKDITRLPKLDDSSLLSVAHVRIIPSLLQKGMPRILKLASSLQPLFSVYVFFFFFLSVKVQPTLLMYLTLRSIQASEFTRGLYPGISRKKYRYSSSRSIKLDQIYAATRC